MPPLPMVDLPCSTGCGGSARTVAGSVPREPVLCDACRAGRSKRGAAPPVYGHPCDRDGCGNICDRITGAQRRRWELGRPVYCSTACRKAATSRLISCGWCRKPMLVNGHHGHGGRGQVYCSTACSADGRRNPPRACKTCGELFHPRAGERRRFCSRACAARSRTRLAPDTVLRTCITCGRRDPVSRDTARHHPACSLACAQAAGLPGYRPRTGDETRQDCH